MTSSPNTNTTADGTLSIQVWPAYVGACEMHPLLTAFSEPQHSYYKRGQIMWGPAGPDLPELAGQIVGRAQILVPPGEYTHLAYFYGPEGPCMAGDGFQLAHPVVLDGKDAVLEVYPITNPHAAMASQAP